MFSVWEFYLSEPSVLFFCYLQLSIKCKMNPFITGWTQRILILIVSPQWSSLSCSSKMSPWVPLHYASLAPPTSTPVSFDLISALTQSTAIVRLCEVLSICPQISDLIWNFLVLMLDSKLSPTWVCMTSVSCSTKNFTAGETSEMLVHGNLGSMFLWTVQMFTSSLHSLLLLHLFHWAPLSFTLDFSAQMCLIGDQQLDVFILCQVSAGHNSNNSCLFTECSVRA